MKKVFVTYGDEGFIFSKARLCKEVATTGEFDEIIAYGIDSLSDELKNSDIFKMPRGGLWSWKPDVIHTSVAKLADGDVLMYLDAGSTVVPGTEWKRYWGKLSNYDLIAQRIYGITKNWTRSSLMDYFPKAGRKWRDDFQYSAMIVMLRVTPFTRRFVERWREIMLVHPELISDVPDDEIVNEARNFHQNRYDQAVYSALVHEALNDEIYRRKIYTQWEHVEDRDPIRNQVIFATRIGDKRKAGGVFKLSRAKRVVRDLCLIPMLSLVRFLRGMYWREIV